MSLFECTNCHAVENTGATQQFWGNRARDLPVLCSECGEGKWHGLFPKKLVNETSYVTNVNGFLEPPGGWPKVGETKPSEFD